MISPFSPSRLLTLLLRLVSYLLLCLPLYSHALSQSDLLPPEKAFSVTLTQQGSSLLVHFEIAPGYYLYRDRMHFNEITGVAVNPQMPVGKVKHDKFFGEQVIYPHSLDITLPLKNPPPPGYSLKVRYQGCADAGVCYPPQTTLLKLGQESKLPGWFTLSSRPTDGGAGTQPALASTGWLSTLGTFWLAGLGMAFTACMYPLLPILSSLIAGQGSTLTRRKGGVLALAYVQGLALTYTIVGIIAGLTGSLLTVWMQQPGVVLTSSALMVLMALSMFDLFSIQLPASWQTRLADKANRMPGGHLLTVFGMGVLSALIIGPCVAPPLALALGYIGTTGDAVKGGAALYAMAMGLGTPLLLIGLFGGHILPKAGGWMKNVKSGFGVIMLGLSLWLASPFLPGMIVMLLWATLGVGCAVFLHAFDALPSNTHPMQRLGKALGLLLFIVGAAELVGALTGQTDPKLPLKAIVGTARIEMAKPAFRSVSDPDGLNRILQTSAQTDRPVLLDFYADWCVSCKEMESETLNNPKVAAALQRFTLVRADVTENLPGHQALLKRFGLFGPPGLIMLANGRELDRVIGFEDAEQFLGHLTSSLNRTAQTSL